MSRYQPKLIEPKWQKYWQEKKTYQAQIEAEKSPSKNVSKKEKKYILDMFPYPSGEGLHVGHFKIYTASDIISRYFRHKGFNVLHPMGWDAFGLPAENYAIKTGVHPKITTEKNISNIKKQMEAVGLSYDWSREIDTTDPQYYKWTQWIFLKLFEHGLAYEDEAPINWCPKDKTGLANEEVVNGKCDRCGTEVERKVIRQWILRITKYADRLLEDLEGLEWPDFIKEMQRNWIGRSTGTILSFTHDSQVFEIEAFTTRIDTVYGVTALVLAPEHPKLAELTSPDQKQFVNSYIEAAKKKSDLERTELAKVKSGVFTGSYAINPVNGERVPIWVADYVLGFYGTGAVMLVPAHDHRDYEFAKKYGLEIRHVIDPEKPSDKPKEPGAFVEAGVLVNSGQFNGLSSAEAKTSITEYLRDIGKGDFRVQYKLRDWIFSRQRYWGEPIPVIHCDSCGIVPVPENELPLRLPDVEKYEPTGTGESPLAAIEDWVKTKCPKCGSQARRETNTMPQWAGSCWYYLRFIDPKNGKLLVDKDAEEYWMPVDWYIGGAEHAVLHLLYARFWHKFLFDIGTVTTKEPFQKLSSVGLVLGPDGAKMSKSKGNVIRPDDIASEYGADTLRVYEAFMGPFENAIAWDPTSINGVYKFLCRVWDVVGRKSGTVEHRKAEVGLNRLIQKVGMDIESLNLNTAVASMMEFVNLVYQADLTHDQKLRFLVVLAPFAPHMAEELWEQLGEKPSIHLHAWPEVKTAFLEEDEVTIAVQVDGKLRDTFVISKDQAEDRKEVEKMAFASEKVQKFTAGKEILKAIYIKGKILSLVTG